MRDLTGIYRLQNSWKLFYNLNGGLYSARFEERDHIFLSLLQNKNGGLYRARTCDLSNVNAAL